MHDKRSFIRRRIEQESLIYAVKNEEDFERALKSPFSVLFLLYGDICSISGLCARARAANKICIVHLDLIDGLAPREVAVDYLARYTEADGLISTRPKLVKRAREQGLFAILRIFLLDSMALQNASSNIRQSRPDMVEVLPGRVGDYFAEIHRQFDVPVIAGGLLASEKDCRKALKDGAVAVSSSHAGQLNLLPSR